MSASSVHSTMSFRWWLVFLGLVSLCSGACHLFPISNPGKDVTINVAGSPNSYVPGTTYPVWLSSKRRFTEFFITVDGETGGGSFQISTDPNVSFSEDCSNTLIQANSRHPITAVRFLWNSPSYGCASISASVHVDGNWEETKFSICALEDSMVQEKPIEPTKCCACDHAKYKIIFEGLWSNALHPKDFPVTSQFTHFSDVIGATHSPNFTMWKEGDYASYGFQQLAEYGVVRELDMELKNSSKHLRSIVRATGLWWPHVNSNTTAQFVVDPRHYLFSVASMFGPSPDWVVGLSSMNMCQEDCTWLESKVIDLYPYDAGTDEGVSYQSPKTPTVPHERIRRITTMYPEDPRAPFYNPTAENFPPVARLYVYKTKEISKKCSDLSEQEILEQVTVSENTEDEGRAGCEVGPYSGWSPCSVTCGKGIRMRQRQYLNVNLANELKCDRQIISREMCVAEDKCPGDEELDETVKPMAPGECDVTAWSDWSECTVTCGIGMKLRQRTFVSSDERVNKKCSLISMMEKEKCMMPVCSGGRSIKLPTSCATTEWSDWSTCSATCGPGFITRLRSFKDPEPEKICFDLVPLEEKVKCTGNAKCTFSGTTAKKICLLPRVTGPCRADFSRYAFDQSSKKCVQFSFGGCRGNKNNFETLEDCQQTCEPSESQSKNALPNSRETGKPQNCVVSKWSEWSPCYPCTNGTRIRTRNVLIQPKNGGRKCPPQIKTVPCSRSEEFCEAMGL